MTEGGSHLVLVNLALVSLVIIAAVGYCGAVAHRLRESRLWRWRAVSFVVGAGLLCAGLLPPLSHAAHHDLRAHMFQHLLLGMFAPLALVFAAPVTVLLSGLPPDGARRIVWLLRTRVIGFLSHPVTALLLNVGSMYLLYATSLYAFSRSSAPVHAWLHIHFIVAGCLFTWAIAGPDPAPNRPTVRDRALVLFVAVAAHALLAKLMVAYQWAGGAVVSAAELESAAKVMYYGGDLAEMLLLAMLLWTAGSFKPEARWSAGEGEGSW